MFGHGIIARNVRDGGASGENFPMYRIKNLIVSFSPSPSYTHTISFAVLPFSQMFCGSIFPGCVCACTFLRGSPKIGYLQPQVIYRDTVFPVAHIAYWYAYILHSDIANCAAERIKKIKKIKFRTISTTTKNNNNNCNNEKSRNRNVTITCRFTIKNVILSESFYSVFSSLSRFLSLSALAALAEPRAKRSECPPPPPLVLLLSANSRDLAMLAHIVSYISMYRISVMCYAINVWRRFAFHSIFCEMQTCHLRSWMTIRKTVCVSKLNSRPKIEWKGKRK